jgi:hypothetical protein
LINKELLRFSFVLFVGAKVIQQNVRGKHFECDKATSLSMIAIDWSFLLFFAVSLNQSLG